MSIEANKVPARACPVAFRDREETWRGRFIASDFVRHDPGLDFEVRGPAGTRKLAELLHVGLSDIVMPVDEVIAEGDRVLARLRLYGRHTGAFHRPSRFGS